MADENTGDIELITVTMEAPEFISEQLEVIRTQLPEEVQHVFAEYLLFEAAILYEKQISKPSISNYLLNMSGEFKSRNRAAENRPPDSGPEFRVVE